MWIADHWKDYAVLDCGGGEKIERWGNQILQRPDPQAIWPRDKDCKVWNKPNAIYHRSNAGGGKWEIRKLPEQWAIHYGDLTFQPVQRFVCFFQCNADFGKKVLFALRLLCFTNIGSDTGTALH